MGLQDELPPAAMPSQMSLPVTPPRAPKVPPPLDQMSPPKEQSVPKRVNEAQPAKFGRISKTVPLLRAPKATQKAKKEEVDDDNDDDLALDEDGED